MSSNNAPIQTIRVRGLFGLYDYDLPGKGLLSDASIIYGDNGVGKSTILKLLFHMLSPAPDKGHRHSLSAIPFECLEVRLTNGVLLTAQRLTNDLTSPLELYVERGVEILAGWLHVPKNKRSEYPEYTESVVRKSTREGIIIQRTSQNSMLSKNARAVGDDAYIQALKQFAPAVFLLSSDRKLDSDLVPDPSDEVQLRQLIYGESPRKMADLLMRSRQIALSQALSTAQGWITGQAVNSVNQGSTNVHSVYANVLRHIADTSKSTATAKAREDYSELINRLEQVSSRSIELAAYEFASANSMDDLMRALQSPDPQIRKLSAELLVPYIESMEERIKAVEGIYTVTNKFVTIVNSLLRDKTVLYKLSRGFSIFNIANKKLEIEHLSSGEQQLLLLFCYILSGRDTPSVFMIDEPEISLNVKWQRHLVSALLDLTRGADIQFLLASHSMELLTQHRKRVVSLESLR